MHIDKYKQPDGTYLDEEGCYHEGAEAMLHSHILGFCMCGDPIENLKYVRDCLQHTYNLKVIHDAAGMHKEKRILYETWNERGKQIMGAAYYFTLYVFDEKELTEHGSSVHGAWLTIKGQDLLEDLIEYLKDK